MRSVVDVDNYDDPFVVIDSQQDAVVAARSVTLRTRYVVVC